MFSDKITLGEFLDYWLSVVSPDLQMTTIYGYNNIIKHIKNVLGGYEINSLKPCNFHLYYESLCSIGLSRNTIRKHHDLLCTAFKTAVFEVLVDNNIMEKVRPPRKQRAVINYYDSEELNRLLKLALNSKLRIVIFACAYLGLKRGELCALTWDDIDFNKHILSINKSMVSGGKNVIIKEPKNNTSNRDLFIPSDLEKLLFIEYQRQKHIRRLKHNYNTAGYVVVGSSGRPHHPNYLSSAFTKFINENELPPLTLHGLRHTFATVANQGGVSLFDISKALGHSTPSVTGKIYTHMTKDTYKKAVSAVSNMIDLSNCK